jgi:hypothetical protein
MEFKGLRSKIFCVGLGLGLGLNSIAAGAVEPLESGDWPMVWSKVVESGSGPVIYDRHRIVPSLFANVLLSAIGVPSSQDPSEIVSRWSRSGIRVSRIEMVQVVDEVRGKRGDGLAKFTYREEARATSPLSIEVVMGGRSPSVGSAKSVRYESGPVSAELGARLAQATEGSLSMRLLWPDGSVTESKIGEGTVLGWKQVFR